MINGKHGQGTHSTKMGADKLAENTPNAPKYICPICLPKPKSLGFLKKAYTGCPLSVEWEKYKDKMPIVYYSAVRGWDLILHQIVFVPKKKVWKVKLFSFFLGVRWIITCGKFSYSLRSWAQHERKEVIQWKMDGNKRNLNCFYSIFTKKRNNHGSF